MNSHWNQQSRDAANMTPKEAWDRGTPLGDAFEAYGNPANWETYKRVRKFGIQIIAEAIPAMFGNDEAAENKFLKENAESSKLHNLLEGQVKAKLLSGDLIAVGFAVPRKPADLPNFVPRDVWQNFHQVDWIHDKLKGSGLEFLSVKLVPKILASRDPDRTSRRMGRPSVKREVFEAFQAMLEIGEVDVSASMSSHYPRIRTWLCEKYPEHEARFSTLTDEAIRRVISPEFRSLKAAKNQ